LNLSVFGANSTSSYLPQFTSASNSVHLKSIAMSEGAQQAALQVVAVTHEFFFATGGCSAVVSKRFVLLLGCCFFRPI
jgi:hypothetical protein